MNNLAINISSNYPDKILWRVAYPLIAISFLFFANDNALVQLLRMPSFYSDILFAVLVTFCIGFYVKYITIYLDKKYDWLCFFRLRLVWQVWLGILLPLFLSMGLECVYLFTLKIPLASSSILHLELPLSFLFLLLINSFYLASFLFQQQQMPNVETASINQATEPPVPDFFTVYKGSNERHIALSDCAWLTSSNKIVWLQTYQGEKFRLQGTLEEWENILKPAHFYRLNRQFLVAPKAIHSITPTETRKLKIHFVLPTEEEVFVSKPNAAAFKYWWKNTRPS